MRATSRKATREIPASEEGAAGSKRGRGLFRMLRARLGAILGGRDLAGLLLLLVPLTAYDLVLSISRLFPDGASGFWRSLPEVAVAAQSSALFGLGYAVFWFGLFAFSSGRVFRWTASVGLSLSACLVVTLATASAIYSQEFGTTLGYGVLRATLSNPGEIASLTGVVPAYMLAIFVEVLVYALFGTWLIAYVAEARGYVRSSSGNRRLSPRSSFAVCVAGIALCSLSLVPGLLGARGSMYGDQTMEIAATAAREYRFGGSDWDVESPLASVALEETRKTERRNVVVVHLESIRARSATPYNENIQTMPYLDSLADQSLLAERAYAPVPYTSKSITSVNCGLYSHPATEIKESERPDAIPANCLPKLLGKQGYRTAWFQSSVKDFENWQQLAENFGYEEFYPLESMNTDGFEKANSWGYEDDIMLEPSRRWLEKNDDEPFAITYVTGTPHHEYFAPTRYGHLDFPRDDRLDDYSNDRRNDYLNSVRYVDFFVKNLIEQYKDMGLYKDTIFVFYGDHGEAFGEHGLQTHGPTPYDETLQVPLIIHDPQRFQDGETVSVDTPVNHLDIAPSVFDMLGYEVTGGKYRGNSLFRPLPEDRTLMFNCRPDVTCAASLKGYEKYIYFYGRKPDEFYDLRKDPFERHNLAEEMRNAELEKLRREFLEWRLKTMAMYR